MQFARFQHDHDSTGHQNGGQDGDAFGSSGFRVGGRLNLLLSTAPWRPDPWADALPQILAPMGVSSIRTMSARAAEQVIKTVPVHLAVVDLSTPMDDNTRDEAGPRVLELLSRLSNHPPTLVIRTPAPQREEHRQMHVALRCNAFAVVDRSHADLERMLQLMQRVLARHYEGRWPGGTA